MSAFRPLPRRIEAIEVRIGVRALSLVAGFVASITASQASGRISGKISFSRSLVALARFGPCNIRIRFEIKEGATYRFLLLCSGSIRPVNCTHAPNAPFCSPAPMEVIGGFLLET
jgi:hypothetical protein